MKGQSNQQKRDALVQQLDRRIALLERWVKEGAPKGAVPASLTKARLWSEPAEGIVKIGSSSSFVKTHQLYGMKVKLIDDLRGALLRRKRTTATSAETRIATLTAQLEEAKRANTNSGDQFVQKEIELQNCQRQLRIALQDIANLNTRLEREKETVKMLRKVNAQLEAKVASGKIVSFPSVGA